MSDMNLKRRDSSSSSSEKENDPEWNPKINLKRVRTESSHEEYVSDSSSTKSNITGGA
jgi:hypothetical protein